jgi:hypothetical protein
MKSTYRKVGAVNAAVTRVCAMGWRGRRRGPAPAARSGCWPRNRGRRARPPTPILPPPLHLPPSSPQGTARTLNVYLTQLENKLLGWATYPSSYRANYLNDGVVVRHDTLPGMNTDPGYL